MEDNQQIKYISGDEFDKIGAVRRGWLETYGQAVKDLKVGQAVIVPCTESCWTNHNHNTCSTTTHIGFILGVGNYKTKHLEKRGTPNNHIAAKRIR